MKNFNYFLIFLMKLSFFVVSSLIFLTSCGVSTTESPIASVDNTSVDTTTPSMSFFVTSVNPGNGGDLGGLAGADAYCQQLATAAGAGDKTWYAYLSTTTVGDIAGIDARDRIGNGPWYNARGVMIAESVEALHGANIFTKDISLDENGNIVSGRGDEINNHDILTGSLPDGTATGSTTDTTCGNWTTGSGGSALVGHHDRIGLDESDSAKSWNSSHGTRGCGLDQLRTTGGAGLYYCFAQ